jgi:hypothetical protein
MQRRGELRVLDIAGVARRGRLEDQHLDLFVGGRAMLVATRNHDRLTRIELDDVVAKFDAELPAPDQKHFVLVLVHMSGEDTLQLDQLELLAIQRGD